MYNKDGRDYFYNAATNASTWKVPAVVTTARAAALAESADVFSSHVRAKLQRKARESWKPHLFTDACTYMDAWIPLKSENRNARDGPTSDAICFDNLPVVQTVRPTCELSNLLHAPKNIELNVTYTHFTGSPIFAVFFQKVCIYDADVR